MIPLGRGGQWLAVLGFPIALLACILLAGRVDLPSDQSTDGYSTARVLDKLGTIAAVPHPIGTPANHAVRDYLVGELRAAGFEVEVQRAEVVSRLIDGTLAGTVENIIGVRKGLRGGGHALMLASHYDAHGHSPGAADAGSGVATILHAVEALADEPFRNDLIVLFSDGEETGLLGAQAFVDQHPLAQRIGAALNFEARGTRGPVLMFETSPDNGELVGLLADSAPAAVADSLFDELYRLMPNSTDMSVFKQAGIAGMNFAFVEGAAHYHTAGDTVDRIAPATLTHYGSYAVPLIRELGQRELPLQRTADVGFFNLTSAELVRYETSLGIWLLISALVLFSLVILQRRAVLGYGRALIGGVGFCLLLSIATALLVALVNQLLLGSIGRVGIAAASDTLLIAHVALAGAVFAALHAWVRKGVHASGIAIAAVLAVCTAILADLPLLVAAVLAGIVSLLSLLLRRSPSTIALSSAAMLVWLMAAAAMALLQPTTMHVLLPPLLGALLIALAAAPLARRFDGAEAAAAAASVLLSVLWLAYYVRMLHIGLGAEAPTLALLPLTLLLPLGAPILERAKPLVVELTAVAHGLVGLGIVAAIGVAASNGPLRDADDLIYVRDLDSSEAYWASGRRYPDSRARSAIGSNPRELPIADLFPTRSGSYFVGAAPLDPAPGPQLQLLSDTVDSGARHLQFRLRPAAAGSEVQLFVRPSKPIRSARLGGREIEVQDGRNGWWRWLYFGMPAEGTTIALELAAGSSYTIRVTEVQREWPLPMQQAAPRGDDDGVSHGYGDMMLTTRTFADAASDITRQ
ncbi:M20/M25/M40 family metallo-hydrolase [Aquimonas sp.]|jgi:hypothetical protein|uniref:M20/M25/M40 family metallo-hydrolase n=1 Tax=Aquimonas sp. TaxID=1872588 RepID=UPI0037BF36F6